MKPEAGSRFLELRACPCEILSEKCEKNRIRKDFVFKYRILIINPTEIIAYM
jgi:hypothetical protein